MPQATRHARILRIHLIPTASHPRLGSVPARRRLARCSTACVCGIRWLQQEQQSRLEGQKNKSGLLPEFHVVAYLGARARACVCAVCGRCSVPEPFSGSRLRSGVLRLRIKLKANRVLCVSLKIFFACGAASDFVENDRFQTGSARGAGARLKNRDFCITNSTFSRFQSKSLAPCGLELSHAP